MTATKRMDVDWWDDFANWCDLSGVDLEYEDDWGPWYECWEAALEAHSCTVDH